MEENMFSPNVCIDVYLCIKHVSKIIYIYNQWLLENFSWRSHRHTVRHSNFFQVQIHCACQWILTLAPKILHLDNNRFSKTFFYNTNHTPPTSIDVWMMDSSWINTRIKTIGPRRTAFCVESDFVKNTRFATAKEQFLYLDNTLFKEPTYLQLINCFFFMNIGSSALANCTSGDNGRRSSRSSLVAANVKIDWLYLGRRKILILGRCRCKGCWNVHFYNVLTRKSKQITV